VRLIFNDLAMGTFQRLVDLRAFIDLLDEGVPLVMQRTKEAYKEQAEREDVEYPDYLLEDQVLDERFAQWMPRFGAYSCLILLYSIVESQLLAYSEKLGAKLQSPLHPKDMRGRGVQQTSLYLNRVASIDVTKDPGWKDIDDLRELRNLIVHRGGKPGKSKDQQDLVTRLTASYPQQFWLPDSWPYQQVWVSMRLCSHLATEIEAFFRRRFKEAGFSEKISDFV